MLFASPDGLNALSESLKWYADEAFYTRTKYFGQLWVIHAFFPAKTFTNGLNAKKNDLVCMGFFSETADKELFENLDGP